MELLWFEQQQPQCHSIPITQWLSRYSELASKLGLSSKTLNKPTYIQWSSAIYPQHIWSKSLILPYLLNQQEQQQQVDYLLQKELPLPLTQVWFDYYYQAMPIATEQAPQNSRLDIFAIEQQNAQQYLEQFTPIKINILDNLVYALLRGFYYLCPTLQNNPEVLWIYQDQQIVIAIQNKPHQLQMLHKTAGNLTALIQQYEQTYPHSAKHYVYYQTAGNTQFSINHCSVSDNKVWQILDNHLPLIPLGCALWGT